MPISYQNRSCAHCFRRSTRVLEQPRVVDQPYINAFRDLPGKAFGTDQVKDQLRRGTGLWKNIAVISKACIADMVINTGYPLRFLNQLCSFSKPARVPAVLYNQKVRLREVCQITDNLVARDRNLNIFGIGSK